jgi:hypothetical protein
LETGFEERYRAVGIFERRSWQDRLLALMWDWRSPNPVCLAAPKDAPFVKDALKAITLDPDSSEALSLMARYKEFHDWDFPAAEREFAELSNLIVTTQVRPISMATSWI